MKRPHMGDLSIERHSRDPKHEPRGLPTASRHGSCAVCPGGVPGLRECLLAPAAHSHHTPVRLVPQADCAGPHTTVQSLAEQEQLTTDNRERAGSSARGWGGHRSAPRRLRDGFAADSRADRGARRRRWTAWEASHNPCPLLRYRRIENQMRKSLAVAAATTGAVRVAGSGVAGRPEGASRRCPRVTPLRAMRFWKGPRPRSRTGVGSWPRQTVASHR